jgi:hypothetical protein
MIPRINVTGAAGPTCQNLIPRLKAHGPVDIVALDETSGEHGDLYPDIRVIEADVFEVIDWPSIFGVKSTLPAGRAGVDLPASRMR